MSLVSFMVIPAGWVTTGSVCLSARGTFLNLQEPLGRFLRVIVSYRATEQKHCSSKKRPQELLALPEKKSRELKLPDTAGLFSPVQFSALGINQKDIDWNLKGGKILFSPFCVLIYPPELFSS